MISLVVEIGDNWNGKKNLESSISGRTGKSLPHSVVCGLFDLRWD